MRATLPVSLAGAAYAATVDYVVDAATVAASRLARRLVVVESDESSGPAGELLSTGLAKLWRNYPRESDVGLAQLIDQTAFLSALRQLADELLLATDHSVDGAELVAVVDRDGAELARSLYPDATFDRAQPTSPAKPALVGDGFRHAAAPYASPLQDRLLLVIGCGRSGTTWLHRLLLTHPDIDGLPRHESWLFEQLEPLWPNRIAEARFVAALRRFADAVLAGGKRPAGFVVEKTPMHSLLLPQIAAVYPDAWVIHLVRDGREVARSISQTPFFNNPDPANAAALWSRVVDEVRRESRRFERFRELHYETVRADAAGQIAALFDWLGLDNGDAVRGEVRASAGERVSAHAGTSVPLGSQSWRTLPRHDVRGIYRNAGYQLRQTGYANRAEVWRGKLLGH